MLDPKFIRENKDFVKKATAAKQVDPKLVDQLLEVDEKRRKLLTERDGFRAKGKVYSEEVVKKALELSKQKNKNFSPEAIEAAREVLGRQNEYSENAIKAAQQQLSEREKELTNVERKFNDLLYQIPNPPTPDVKVGKDESENEVLRKWGELPKFNFKPQDHLEIGKRLDIIDVERAAKVSGARFGYLKNEAVLLEFALVNFALSTLIKEGFVPMIPPILIKTPVFKNLGYAEHQGNENYYFVLGDPNKRSGGEEESEYYLVGTSEHSVVPYFSDEVLDVTELPKRFVSFSSCFRRESGSYGKDTKGILRVHQFDKVEMISFTNPKDGDKEHEFLLSLEEKLLQALEIPYRVVKMCSGDLGAPAARKYDLEAWLPGQGVYRELTSTSTTTDFQSRRLNIKYKDDDKTGFVHTLNGTAFAIGRTIIAILENYQKEDGSVEVPKALIPYVGKKIIQR